MQSCLGLFVDKNLIKYAKVAKDKNTFKVEAYGVKFYEDLEETIQQIIKETYSFQIPISINVSNESYNYSSILNLLKPKDLEKAIETEFEYFCNSNSKNKNAIECRHIKHQNNFSAEEKDKLQVIYAYTDKINVVERLQLLDSYKIGTISPVALTIPNLNNYANGESSMIVNIESETEVTTLVGGNIQRVDKIKKGMNNILKNIAIKENSMSRAYEACKNTTVYTKAGQNLKIEGNEYLEEIIVELADIIEEVRKLVSKSEFTIDNIYLTGIGIVINNIDLFFQENFMDKKTEILIPYFTEKTNTKINVKDYAEVNSAISLALQGLDTKNNEINFSNKGSTINSLKTLLTADVGKGKDIDLKEVFSVKKSFQKEMDGIEKFFLRISYLLIILLVLYIGALQFLTMNINQKINETEEVIADTRGKIAQVSGYKSLVDARNTEYQEVINKIDEENNEKSNSFSSKNAIPNMLNEMMYVIPRGVQVVKIENTAGKSITIEAKAEKYDQLGYFKTALAEEGILVNVTTTKGEKGSNGEITVRITGDLPY